MQPSTWNATNQHWIPQFLLKGFGIRGKASKVLEMDKQTGVVNERNVEDVASKQRLLTESDDELLKEIEVRSAPVIAAIRRRRSNIGEEGRRNLDALILAMVRNDPFSGFDYDKTRMEVVGNVANQLAGAIEQEGGTVSPDDLEDLMNEWVNRDYLNIAMAREDNIVVKALRSMGLSAFQPEEGELFVIGESPVLIVRNTVNAGTSLLNPGSQVILPIHSRCVLVYDWRTQFNVIDDGGFMKKEQVRSLNRDYYHGLNCRYIYGRTYDSLKNSRMLQLHWMPQERSTDVNDGWITMQSELQRKSKLQVVQDAEQIADLNSLARHLVQNAKANFRNPSVGDAI